MIILSRTTIFAIVLISFFSGSAGAWVHGSVPWISAIGSLIYSGINSASNSALWIQSSMSGTATDTLFAPINYLYIPTDSINESGGGSVDGLTINHAFGASAVGGRKGLNVILQQTATTGNTTLGPAYVGAAFQSWGFHNDGGISGTPTGEVFGINPQAILGASATYWARAVASEFNVTVASGASVAHKLGIEVTQASNDKVQGSLADIGVSIGNQSGAVGWTCALCFGTNDAIFPTTTGGTVIGVWGTGQTAPGTSFGTALYGIDFSGLTISAGGSPFLAPLITPSSSSATCKQGAIEWDANYVYICTATNTFKRATLATF